MDQPITTTNQLAHCLSLLQAATEPITAAHLAGALSLGGCHESQRRQIRTIIKKLRENGERIAATMQTGYFIAYHDDVWKAYNESRQIEAKTTLSQTHRRNKAIPDKYQDKLFTPGPGHGNL